ncbi:MAG: tail fiber protein [Halothiobacillaceae bacterium]|jgi:hypothetical protein|nr:tail fiber protein [Halothiobacillaceae bacterium]
MASFRVSSRSHWIPLAMLCATATVSPLHAEPVPFQVSGSLLNKTSGGPERGAQLVRFTLYADARPDAAVLWSETLLVEFVDGRYSVTLGQTAGNPLPETLDRRTAVLGVKIGEDDELFPRLSLVPEFAREASNATGDLTPRSLSISTARGLVPVIDAGGNWIGQTGPGTGKGEKGDPGPQGPAGAQGPQGVAGAQGPAGPQGATGASGPQGVPGMAGPQGPEGAAGAAGSPGAQGAQGAQGSTGAGVLSGNVDPQATDGREGDFYLNTLTSTLFGPKLSGNWGVGVPLIGPQGAQGNQGPQGATGLTGPAGPQGAAGIAGPQGATGATGPQGATGPAGATGATGATGSPGAQGPAGAQGIQGTTGPVGPAGPQGPQGASGDSTFADRFGTSTGAGVESNGVDCTLGQMMLFANTNRGNGIPANGQILAISSNTALFSLLGTTYGGNGTTTFALPDMRPVTPDKMSWYICDQGVFPSTR